MTYKGLCLAFALMGMFNTNGFAMVSDCKPDAGFGNEIIMNLAFDIDSSTTSVPGGTELASDSQYYPLRCKFTGTSSQDNSVYFKNTMPSNVKQILINSGIAVTQQLLVPLGNPVYITNSVVPNIHLGYWSERPNNENIGFLISYKFSAIKIDGVSLKPFDTGQFYLGTHVNYLGNELGAPIFLRIVGNLINLCPSPTVNVTASDGGSVNFGTISPQNMDAGQTITKSFNLGLNVSENCQTGLNVSIKFESNGNSIINNKFLNLDNGLQILLKDASSTEIVYSQTYLIGELLPTAPLNVPYTATLSKSSVGPIQSGPFSKTIKAVISY